MSKQTLIPRQDLFSNPDKASVQLSPDGSRISYLASLDGVLNVWVGPVDDPAAAQPVTRDTGRGIRFFSWAYSGTHILYIQDKDGDENWHLYSVNLETDTEKDLTPIENVQAQFQGLSHRVPNAVLVGLNDRLPQLHDVYRIDIETGERTLMQQNDENFVGFVSDDDYNMRFARQLLPDGTGKYFKPDGDGGWTEFLSVPHSDSLTTNIFGFDKSGKLVYMTDSRERDTAALFTLDTETGTKTLVAEDPKSDLSGLMTHPTENTIEAAAFNYERKTWTILDESIKADLEYLRTVTDGDIEITSRTHDDRQWIAAFLMDNGPIRYYHYDRDARNATFLFTNRAALEKHTLAKMHPVVIDSRDGLKMVSYYTLPVGSDTQTPGRPDKPLPLVLFVHGGPWARDTWGYHPYHQWLANRGYAVLSVNFRSSVGFGKDFLNAGDLQWGRKMHDDLLDAVDWAVAEGITTQNQVAIMGGSYGGYATLAGLTFTPDRFVCGVDIVGPSNLITLIDSVPPYWEPMIALFRKRMGDNTTEEGRALLTERSPLTHVNQIKRPLLIAQGANDPRVKRAESDQIVEAMEAKNIPVTYALYPDEGHGFARPENNLSFAAITEGFLATHLEGEFEPIGDDFTGSSLEILSGAEGVPGLAETLKS